MTTTTLTAVTPRFALDVEAARAWLELAEQETEAGTRSECDSPDEFALYAEYGAVWHDSGVAGPSIDELLRYALTKGVLTIPAGYSLDFEQDHDENEIGYWWFVGVGEHPYLNLRTSWESLRGLGNPDARGAAAALAVLDEAVWAANHELDNLDRYVASRTAAHSSDPAERERTYREVVDCVCVENCAEYPPTACSLSGTPHVHPDDGSGTFGPRPVHPDAPGDH